MRQLWHDAGRVVGADSCCEYVIRSMGNWPNWVVVFFPLIFLFTDLNKCNTGDVCFMLSQLLFVRFKVHL